MGQKILFPLSDGSTSLTEREVELCRKVDERHSSTWIGGVDEEAALQAVIRRDHLSSHNQERLRLLQEEI